MINKKIIEEFKYTQYGVPVLQLGFGMNLFLPRPFKKHKKDVLKLWKMYLDLIGSNIFTWARLGGIAKSHKVSKATYTRIENMLNGTKDYGNTCWISISDGNMDDMGKFSFNLTGYEEPNDEEFDTESSHIEMIIPIEFVSKIGFEKVAKTFMKMTNHIKYNTGVVGYIMHRSPYKFYVIIKAMKELSERFEGVEISANERLCYTATEGLTTVNWITLVGNTHFNKLDKNIEFPLSCKVVKQKYGIAIQTGKKASIGDKKAENNDLVDLKKLYNLLKPIQCIDEDYNFDPDDFDEKETEKWLQRFNKST